MEPPRSPAVRAMMVVGLVGALLLALPTVVARITTEARQYGLHNVPPTEVGLVLGTDVSSEGRPSKALAARLDLGAEAYHAGKVQVILVSGASGSAAHDQTAVMVHEMQRRGVPADHIVEDPQGWDTYSSCWRAKHVYGVEELTVISQRWHVTRALVLCSGMDIEAHGLGDTSFNRERPVHYLLWLVREVGAHVKARINLAQGRTGPVDPPSDAVARALAS